MAKPTLDLYSAYLDDLVADGPWELYDSSWHTFELLPKQPIVIPKRAPRGYGKGAWVQSRMWISDEEVQNWEEAVERARMRARGKTARPDQTKDYSTSRIR